MTIPFIQAPTFLDLAEVVIPEDMDGVSLKPVWQEGQVRVLLCILKRRSPCGVYTCVGGNR